MIDYKTFPILDKDSLELIINSFTSIISVIVGGYFGQKLTNDANKKSKYDAERDKKLQEANYIFFTVVEMTNSTIKICNAYSKQMNEKAEGNFHHLSQKIMPVVGATRSNFELDYSKMGILISYTERDFFNDIMQLKEISNHIISISGHYKEQREKATNKLLSIRSGETNGVSINTPLTIEEIKSIEPEFAGADAILHAIIDLIPHATDLSVRISKNCGPELKKILNDERFTSSFEIANYENQNTSSNN